MNRAHPTTRLPLAHWAPFQHTRTSRAPGLTPAHCILGGHPRALDTKGPPHAPRHPYLLAELKACLHTRPYSPAGSLDPLEQRPISSRLAHPTPTPRGIYCPLLRPHSATSSLPAPSSPATGEDPARGCGPLPSAPRRRWRLRRGGEKTRWSRGGTCLPALGVPLFITGLIPSCSSSHLRGHLGKLCQMKPPGTGESLRGAPAEVWGGPGSLGVPGAGPPGLLHLCSPHPPLTRRPSAIGTVCHPCLGETGDEGA